jgi:response regulator RpfG family c-di-GMP phosphodiesterase
LIRVSNESDTESDMINLNKSSYRYSYNRHSVLIIDDDPLSIGIIEYELRHDYRIYSALSGEAGLEIARRERPDLILLDTLSASELLPLIA